MFVTLPMHMWLRQSIQQQRPLYRVCGGTLNLLEMGKALTQKFGYRYPFPHFTVPKAAFPSLIAPVFGHSRQFVN